MSRSLSELLARIFRDVGLSPDWESLAEGPWPQKELAAGRPRRAPGGS